MSNKQKGFTLVEAAVIVVIVAVIGIIAWKAWEMISSKTSSTTDSSVQVPATINNSSDLDKASAALDATDIEGSESTEIDSEISF